MSLASRIVHRWNDETDRTCCGIGNARAKKLRGIWVQDGGPLASMFRWCRRCENAQEERHGNA